MAKLKQLTPQQIKSVRKQSNAAVITSDGTAEAPPSGKELLRVELYDASAIKNSLDDLAKQTVLEAGYEEELMISNIKLGLGFAAIGVALYTQFGTGKFPASWWTVFGCVVLYAVITVGLNVYASLVEGDAFLVSRPRRAGDCGVFVHSRLARYQDQYTLRVTSRKQKSRHVSQTTSITRYFHEDGYMTEESFRAEVLALLAQYEASTGGSSSGSSAQKKQQ